ncbi:hypothetical protein [Aquisalinus flavus]|uniref:Uncharacterized protein n=1 Tax=Aquisalinus flavus TaxID=1526572 RepID=A0A8J2V6M9_9PROT|nr:hypothetical protein [Aquisalinus flavus]MBD0425496.1 hypothetical protein [Aquisalinus flavus]UNE48872.1 hypothetical protein FF099_12835 [Aquisalinus flavus]GGD15637.1 hypothetical protein GCM10011342_25480 [Aquisalinus flavus]
MSNTHDSGQKWHLARMAMIAAILGLLPALVLAAKNIMTLGFDDLQLNMLIYTALFLFLFAVIFLALYLSHKLRIQKKKKEPAWLSYPATIPATRYIAPAIPAATSA